MPGYRGRTKRTETIMLRVTPEQKQRWTSYADYFGVGTLIRTAVEAYMKAPPDGRKRKLDAER